VKTPTSDYVNESPAQRLARLETHLADQGEYITACDKLITEQRQDLADMTAVLLETFNIITKNSASDRASRVKQLIPKVQEIRSRLT
jgi:uncharacterized coiled-coil protein SlyX